jgi:hypothetical protein
MQKRKAVSVLLFFCLTGLVSAQDQETSGWTQNLAVKAKAGFEYFGRTISWGDTDETAQLSALLFTFRPRLILSDRVSLGAVVGYGLSDFDTVTFRELPLSVELETGKIGGWLFGAELEAAIWETGNFEIGAQAGYVIYKGKEDSFDIPGLAVTGDLATEPQWQRIRAGLKVTYIPVAYFYPFARISYDHLWGQFDVQQTVLDLSENQEVDITGQGKIHVGVGLSYEPADRFIFEGELHILPHADKVDLGVSVGLSYLF